MSAAALHAILVVDDTPENIDILRDLLHDTYRVLAAKSGVVALDLIARNQVPPSLVLLDIMMPELNGFDTLARLRHLPGCSQVPVIFISAMGDLLSKTQGLALGAVDYITKPFEPEEVLARVRTHLALADARVTLERQNKELELAAQMREDVERIMRHDLKSPLNSIIATAQFELSNEGLDPNLKESLEIIEQSGRDTIAMINLSLGLFKMEQGHYQLQAEPVELLALIERIYRETQALQSAGRLTLSITAPERVADPGWTVSSESLLCYSLLGNLVRNALEAAPAGSEITVCLQARPAGNSPVGGQSAIRLVIRNQGEIPLSIREKLFAKFATAGKSGGTGLGLYSARMIATTMGATLQADSSEPGYTSFWIDFPPESVEN